MKARSLKTQKMVLLGLLTALLIVMSMTPIGYLNVGMLAITFNMIPVAIASIAIGPLGGAIVGGVFGITSFLQAMGIGGASALGVICFEINPFFTFIHRFFSRVLAGYLTGFIFRFLQKHVKFPLASAAAGFFAAILNTAFFMLSLVLLFGNTEYMKELIGGQNIFIFICSYVGINAVFETLVSSAITSGIAGALKRAKLIHIPNERKNKGE